MRIAEIVVGRCRIGVEANSVAETDHGIVIVLERHLRIAQIVVGLDEIGI